MRKNNKKRSSSLLTKTGVILVTILFIVAMALIFVTTALMISIAGRQRVYTNAIDSQARLTCLSLSQAIWQAIYSQQITDADLVSLAKGTAGNGSVVVFTNSDLPGMGLGDSECTAYFYCIGDPSKIGIECKCEIDGTAQYYRMVLERNRGEDVPRPMFNMTVELGNPGMLNAFNFGIDASQIDGHDRNKQQQYLTNSAGETIDDNVIFIHGNGTTSNQGGSGFYCRVVAEGHVYLRDAVFTDDVYFVGEDAIFDFTSTSQTSVQAGESPRRGDLYFWGSNLPFIGQQAGTTMSTFNNIYFDYRELDPSTSSLHYNTSSRGFNAAGGTRDSGANNTYFLRNYNNTPPWGIAGNVYYELPASGSAAGAYLADAPSNWTSFAAGSDKVPANLNDYLIVDEGIIDTVGEVTDPTDGYGTHANHTDAVEITDATDTITGSVGYYYIDGTDIDHRINCDVSSGPITIYVDSSFEIRPESSGEAGFFVVTDGAVENYVNFVLESGSHINVATTTSDKATGFVDTRCFNNTTYVDPHNINQNKIPRIFIFTAYASSSNATALTLGDTATNGGVVCTAFLGFYPTTRGGTDGCSLGLHNVAGGTYGTVYYGRIACSNMGNANDNGGNLNIPYCPGMPGSLDDRGYAYRDNTDFSVVQDECEFFTA